MELRQSESRERWTVAGSAMELRAIEVGGFCISDSWCPPRSVPRRPDGTSASILFAVDGSFEEDAPTHGPRRGPYQVSLRPLAQPAAIRAGERGARCVVIELTPERLARVREVTSLFHTSLDTTEAGVGGAARRLWREIDRGCSSKLGLEALVLELLARLARLDPHEPEWAGMIALVSRSAGTIADISRAVGVPAPDIVRYVRARHDCSVAEYVRRCRVAAAAEALVTSQATIAEISTEFGFYDQSHFTKTFKSETGMTPRRYRVAFGSQ